MNKKIKYILLMLLMSFLVACGGNKEAEKTKKLDEVNLILDWYPNAIHSFLYNGIKNGYFEKEGIKLNIHYPSNASDPLTLVAAKKADIGMYYMQHLLIAVANEDIPVKSIGAITQGPLNVIIALKENNINRPKDLEGKTVGYAGAATTEKVLRDMIKNDGGDPKSLKLMDVGFELLTSMITKRVDATNGGLVNHEVPVMKEKGFDVTYFFPSDYGIPNYYEEVFVANTDFIKEKKDVYKRFLKACEKGFNDMENKKDESLDILLDAQEVAEFPLTRSVEKQSLNTLLPIMETENNKFLSQNEKTWQNNIDWMYDKGLINKKINPQDAYIIID